MNAPAATSAIPVPTSEQDRLGSVALDQWRGLALVLVLISHGFYFTDRVNGLGRVGVNLFFFISGILVFRSLSRTRTATAWERTRSYWWRRLRRLYPALVAYVLAMLPVAWLLQHRPNLPPNSDFIFYLKGMLPAFTAVINYCDWAPWSLGHLWSVACEIQFYLLAPLVLIAGGATMRQRNLVFGILLVILTGLGLAQPIIHHWKPEIDEWKYHFEFAVWPMMLGFVCEHQRDWLRRICGSLVARIYWIGFGVGGLSLVLIPFGMGTKLAVVAAGTLLLAPCLMAYLFGRPLPEIPGRWLKWLGERTYSIYLWQEPFTISGYLPNFLHPAGAVISVAVGGFWFYLFERPFLSAGRRK